MLESNKKFNQRHWHYALLLSSHLAIFACLALWLWQPTRILIQNLDNQTFWFLNATLIDSPFFQTFWGLLNHRREVWLNLVLTIGINILIVCFAPPKQRFTLLKQFIYFWVFFELGLWIEDTIIFKYLAIQRASPSLVISPFVMLSEALNNTYIVDHSTHSFPSGHAFALIYWMLFTSFTSVKKIRFLVVFIALFLCLPRLFSGAHWITDTLFSGLLAFAWLSWALAIPYYLWNYTFHKQNFRVKLNSRHIKK